MLCDRCNGDGQIEEDPTTEILIYTKCPKCNGKGEIYT